METGLTSRTRTANSRYQATVDLYLAKTIAQRWLDSQWADTSARIVICDHLTRERPLGWVFCYQSEEYLETKDPKDQLAGNAPLIVDRADGSVHVTGTATRRIHG